MTADREMDAIIDKANSRRKNMELGHKKEKISKRNEQTRWREPEQRAVK